MNNTKIVVENEEYVVRIISANTDWQWKIKNEAINIKNGEYSKLLIEVNKYLQEAFKFVEN